MPKMTKAESKFPTSLISSHGSQSSNQGSWSKLGKRRRFSMLKLTDYIHDECAIMSPILKSGVGVVRERGWERILSAIILHYVVLLAVVFPLVGLGVLAHVPYWQDHTQGIYSDSFNNCNANGSFTPEPKPTFNLWESSGFFVSSSFPSEEVVWLSQSSLPTLSRMAQTFLFPISPFFTSPDTSSDRTADDNNVLGQLHLQCRQIYRHYVGYCG